MEPKNDPEWVKRIKSSMIRVRTVYCPRVIVLDHKDRSSGLWRSGQGFFTFTLFTPLAAALVQGPRASGD
jgi:hypothetical protein